MFNIDVAGLSVEGVGQGAKLPLGLSVFGPVCNIATFVGALAECIRV